jgi:hypothetical protein
MKQKTIAAITAALTIIALMAMQSPASAQGIIEIVEVDITVQQPMEGEPVLRYPDESEPGPGTEPGENEPLDMTDIVMAIEEQTRMMKLGFGVVAGAVIGLAFVTKWRPGV